MVEEVIPLGEHDLSIMRPREAESLLDEEAFDARDEFMPYWAELWPSGVALARELARRALRGARVLELGCGLGVPSVAAALAGGRVLATDWAQEAVDMAASNARRNGVELETAVVDWRRPEALLERAPWDLVLAADVLYEARNVGPLLDLIPQLGGEMWLADPGRATAEPFLLRAAAWRQGVVERQGVRIFKLRATA
jgi:predicted nicotinamide N-methyase